MPRSISIENIAKAVIKGIQNAQKSYVNLTGGLWVWQGPEYFITVKIAEAITKLKGSKYITLENSAKFALQDAGGIGRGRLPVDIRSSGKMDILLWWAKDEPRAIIEVKSQRLSKENYRKDIKRIKQFLLKGKENNSMQFGIFAYYDSANDGNKKSAKSKLNERKKHIAEDIKSMLDNKLTLKPYSSRIKEEKESAWIAVCFVIKPITI